MLTEEILRMVLMGSGAVLVLVLAVAAFELIRALRWVRYTVEDLQPAIKEATEILETLQPTIKHANEILIAIEPAVQRIDPMIERASLTIDAVNLEIMRADQILANLTDVTDAASGAVRKVSNIADAPLNLLTSATDKVRNIFTDKKVEKTTQAALMEAQEQTEYAVAEAEAAAEAEPEVTAAIAVDETPAAAVGYSLIDEAAAPFEPATPAEAVAPVEAATAITGEFQAVPAVESATVAALDATLAMPPVALEAEAPAPTSATAPAPAPTPELFPIPTTAPTPAPASVVSELSAIPIAAPEAEPENEMIPPYQNDIDVVEPGGTVKPEWPF